MISSQDESIYDMFINLIPDNIIAATFTTHYTALVALDPHNLTLGYKKVSERAFKPNMLGLCVFSLILGFAVKQLDSKANTVCQILHETKDIVMHVMMGLLKVMPIGMFFWLCEEAIKMKSPETNNHADSAMTLPVTIQCMEGTNKLSKLVSQFVLPLAMILNMNGSAIIFSLIMTMSLPGAPGGGSSLITFIAYCAIIGINNPMDAYQAIVNHMLSLYYTNKIKKDVEDSMLIWLKK
ncbi:unnamed protein product [Medioppia subpectinata]|uniref:Amino acid transporter n=1 Tax=Medioppia subpectinata TaxID=1979941 RepID=A0A7R9L418_9ACAR|nr:unnamed protein product [Medioppia subpectinata]CAG2115178.1 unnamed protein product [Medioppia subpectinata]